MRTILFFLFSLSLLHAGIPQNGLVAHFDFEDEPDQNVVGNLVSTTNPVPLPDGTLVGDATFGTTNPILGSYLQLDGNGDYVDIDDTASNPFFDNIPNQWSAAAWFRPDRAPANSERFFVFETSNGFPISLGLRESASNSQNTTVEVFAVNSQRIQIEIPDTQITEWNHILITYQGNSSSTTAGGDLTVYLNGVAPAPLPITSDLDANTNGFHIGTFRSANDRWFPGAIDEVALWNRALTTDEAGDFFTIVTTNEDEDDGNPDPANGNGTSLREAITHSSGNQIILFDPSLNSQTLVLTEGQLIIGQNRIICIIAPPNGFTIDANGAVTEHRVMEIQRNATVDLHGLTFTGGNVTDDVPFNSTGGAIFVNGSGMGNQTSLSLNNCTLSENSAALFGGGIYNDAGDGNATLSLNNCILSGNSASRGGGIYNDAINGNGSLNLSNCTLSGNSASPLSEEVDSGHDGGGIYSTNIFSGNATLNLSNCTLSGNSASNDGGGIFSDGSILSGSATLNLSNCTLSENSASNDGGGIFSDGDGGSATLNLSNTILAGNTASTGPDLSQTFTTVTETGDNLFSETTPIDPLLAPLGDYGGPTQTRHPLAGSPAILTEESDTTRTDQRGFTLTGPPTIGAVKLGPVTIVNDSGDDAETETTLRRALTDLAATPTLGAVINFAPELDGQTITLTNGQLTVPGTANGLFIYASNLPKGLTIDANGAVTEHRVMEVQQNATVALHDLTFTGGNDSGGGIFVNGTGSGTQTSLSLNNCTLSDNSDGSALGGAIYNNANGGSATLSLRNCTLSGNSANLGGGIMNLGRSGSATLSLINCTLSDNSATSGGGIYSDSLFSGSATLSLSNCTLSGNSSNNNGGGIFSDAAGGSLTASLSNCIIWNNSANDSTTDPFASVSNDAGSSPTYSHCLVANSGGSDSWNSALGIDSGNNIDADPLFASTNGGRPFLLAGSPALDAGDNTLNSEPFDLAGNDRIQNGTIDLGAFEGTIIPTFPLLFPNSDPAADDNNNGLTNYIDYALGGNPTAALEPSLLPTLGGNQLTFSFRNNAADVFPEYQRSTNLLPDSWTELILGTDYTLSSESINGSTTTQTLELLTTDPTLFFREELSETAP